MNNETTNRTNNGTIATINDVINLIGKEGCIGCYASMKSRTPHIYAYQCELLGHDILEYVSSL